MQLLNFLISWAERVYEWFGSLYSYARNVILNVSGWILARAAETLHNAINWAFNAIRDALGTAWDWVILKYVEVRDFILYIRGWLLSRIDEVYQWASARFSEISDVAASWVQFVIDTAAGFVNNLQDTVAGWIQLAIDTAAGLVNASQDWLQSQINTLIGDVQSIKAFVSGLNDAGTGVLATFLGNPFGFIMTYVWDVFSDLLCYGLAYGFGTVKYQLPPLPDWNGGGITGGFGGPVTIQKDIEGLVMPLSSISISGYTFSNSHPGIDLALSDGQAVFAMHDGVVSYAGWSSVGYGNMVAIQDTQWFTRYAHLKQVNVRAGENVKAGQVIGLGNSTGNSTGPHLHLEIKRNGVYIDPLTVLT